MKKSTKAIVVSSVIFASTLTPMAHAVSTEAKQGTSFFTSTILGAVAGGPVGFMLGAIGGAYMGEQIKKADSLEESQTLLDETELALTHSQIEITRLENQLQLAQRDKEQIQMQQLAINNLKFQVMFRTGKDELTARAKSKLQTLAQFLQENPNLMVRLNGHADPRGTDRYNNVLSDFRAQNVENDLVSAGIDTSRIERKAHGALASTAIKGDLEAYAMERAVNIEIINPANQQSVALH